MTAFYIIVGILAFLSLLLLAPIRLIVIYDGELLFRIRYLFIVKQILPPKNRKKPEKKKKPKEKKKETKEQRDKTSISDMFKEDGVAATLAYLKEIASLATSGLKRIAHILVVDRCDLSMVIADEDPAKTAISYGTACGVVFPAQAALEGAMTVRRRDVRVTPDFNAKESRVTFHICLHALMIRVLLEAGRLFYLLVTKTIDKKEREEAEQKVNGR